MIGAVAILGTAPWRRAPRLLLRRPAVLGAIAGTCALLAIAAASGPLFLSSVGAAALQRRVAEQCPEADRPALRTFRGDTAALRAADATAGGALRAAGLPPAYRATDISLRAPFGSTDTPVPLTVHSRADLFEHVRTVGGGGSGLWVSDLEADRSGVRIGDTVPVGAGRFPIVGVYEDLAGPGPDRKLPAYWCTWSLAIVPSLERRPPPFLLADEATVHRLVDMLATDRDGAFDVGADSVWYSAVDTGRLTLAGAQNVLARRDRLAASLGLGWEVRTGLDDDLRAARATRDGVRGAIT